LSRSQLLRFGGISWSDAQPATGGAADAVQVVCRKCAAALGSRDREHRWQRVRPRP